MSAKGRKEEEKDQGQTDRIIPADEISEHLEAMQKLMSPQEQAEMKEHWAELYSAAAFRQVAQRCIKEREAREESLKSVSKALSVPMDQLDAVEDSETMDIDLAVLDKYLDYLGIGAWFDRWRDIYYDAILGGPTDEVIDFRPVRFPRPANPTVYCFKVTLLGVKPPVWRQIELPDTSTFWELHCAIQDAMPWESYHLHEFEIKDPRTARVKRIGLPVKDMTSPLVLLDWKVALSAMFSMESSSAVYMYDFGDCWKHDLFLEGIYPRQQGMKYPRCLAGARTCPPEDCGGVSGYHGFLDAMRNEKHPEHETMANWIGQESFDPDRFVLEKVRFSNARKRLLKLRDNMVR